MFSTPTSLPSLSYTQMDLAVCRQDVEVKCPSCFTALLGGFLNDCLRCHELITTELPVGVKKMGIQSYEVLLLHKSCW